VDVAEKRATYPAPEDAHRQRVEALQTATQQAHQGVDGLNAQLRQLETARAEVKAELEALQEKEKYLEELIDKVEPAIRHKLSLYAHISKIVWNYESSNKIAGIMDDPRRSILKSFDLGTDVNFESVNKLWHIIDGDE
jgi:kinetochore protein Spc24